MGCRLSDHGIETFYAEDYTEAEIRRDLPPRAPRQGAATPTRSLKFKSAMLYEFAVMDHEKGWTQQFHFGALRNNNTRMFQALGPGHGLRLDRRLRRSPGRWRGSSTGSTATAGWPRRSSTTSIRPTTTWWPR